MAIKQLLTHQIPTKLGFKFNLNEMIPTNQFQGKWKGRFPQECLEISRTTRRHSSSLGRKSSVCCSRERWLSSRLTCFRSARYQTYNQHILILAIYEYIWGYWIQLLYYGYKMFCVYIYMYVSYIILRYHDTMLIFGYLWLIWLIHLQFRGACNWGASTLWVYPILSYCGWESVQDTSKNGNHRVKTKKNEPAKKMGN